MEQGASAMSEQPPRGAQGEPGQARPTAPDRRRIRNTTVLVSLIALAFYVGFIIMMLMRAIR
jgi:hypothetical protein